MVALLMPLPMTEQASQPEMRSFGWWLKHQLDRRGWNQSEFARRAGIDRGVVSHWVGDRRKPGLESTQLIADTLGVSVEVVLARLGLDPSALQPVDSRLESVLERLRRIEPTEDRLIALENIVQGWADMDRRRGRN